MSTSTIHKQAADTNAAESSTQSSSCSETSPSTENNDISSSSNGTTQPESNKKSNNTSSCHNNNNNSSSNDADSSSNGSSSNNNGNVSTSNNPFARATSSSVSSTPATATASQSSDHSKPVLAPSKLGGFGSSGASSCFGSSFGSSSILAAPKLGTISSSSSSVLAPSKLFGGVSTTIPKIIHPATSSVASVVLESKFKLKPSILGSAVTSNPFRKVPAMSDIDDGSKEEADSKAENASSDDNSKTSVAKNNNTADSSSEAETAPQSIISTSTPPPSPPITSSNNTKTPDTSAAAVDSTKCPPSSSSSSSNNNNKSSSKDASCGVASSSSEESSSSRSVFGVFGNISASATPASAAGLDKRPVAASSPNPPPTLSSNGVKSPLPGPAGASASSFIFGQNLHTRITGAADDDDSAAGETASAGAESPDNIFTAAASTLATNSGGSGISDAVNGGPGKSLETSSRELAEKESREKRKFEEVEVLTGEETESNVLQMNCKVYSWVRGTWQERGRGLLRLNDWGTGGVEMHSRLVVRTQGTLTIMLNTNIWSEMSLERASNKSVRFTASDFDGQPKIYLVMGHPKDIELLYTSLEYRVSNSRHREEKESKRARIEDQPSSSTPSV